MPNRSLQDPEVHKTKEAIEFFTRLGNRYNISHVAQVSSFPTVDYRFSLNLNLNWLWTRYSLSFSLKGGP